MPPLSRVLPDGAPALSRDRGALVPTVSHLSVATHALGSPVPDLALLVRKTPGEAGRKQRRKRCAGRCLTHRLSFRLRRSRRPGTRNHRSCGPSRWAGRRRPEASAVARPSALGSTSRGRSRQRCAGHRPSSSLPLKGEMSAPPAEGGKARQRRHAASLPRPPGRRASAEPGSGSPGANGLTPECCHTRPRLAGPGSRVARPGRRQGEAGHKQGRKRCAGRCLTHRLSWLCASSSANWGGREADHAAYGVRASCAL